ncbi:MAG: tetratricopeptide repeat protein [Chthoniobacterales bacterium]
MKRSLFALLLFLVPLVVFADVRSIGGNEEKYSDSKNPVAAKLYNDGCNAIYKDNNPVEAITLFTKALELDPNYVKALDNLGTCYRRTGDFDKAIDCYKKSIAIFPNGSFAHTNLALIYQMQKKTVLAVEEYKVVNRLNPSDPEGFYGLGNTYLNSGDYTAAIANAKEAVRLYQVSKNSLLGDGEELLATAYMANGNNTEARSWATKAAQHKPEISADLKKLLK